MDVYAGQTGRAILRMRDAQGRETPNYDEAHGIVYGLISGPEDVARIEDEDAEPKDARITTLRAHTADEPDSVFQVEFDGRIGPDENLVRLVSAPLRVLEPPPGEAVGGEFELVFEQQQS